MRARDVYICERGDEDHVGDLRSSRSLYAMSDTPRHEARTFVSTNRCVGGRHGSP